VSQLLRVLIADDEPDAREKLHRLLRDAHDVRVIGEAANGLEVVAAIESLRPDVVFLDIRMPELDGFEVIESLTESSAGPKIVFVSAYDEYAVRAFDVRALDYMLKPFDDERVEEALRRVRQIMEYEQRPSAETLRSLVGRVRGMDEADVDLSVTPVLQPYLDRICIRSLGRTQFVRACDVEWIEAYGNYVRIHAGSTRALLRQALRRFAEQLDPNMFCRIHRSAVVNLTCVEDMRPTDTGDYILKLRSGVRLKLSRVYRAELDRKLGRKG
jgi:two-component system LytT family response regulator